MYDSTRDLYIQDWGRNGSTRPEDLNVIRAEATLKIVREASGFFVGKARSNINRIMNETGVQSLDINSTYFFVFVNL